MPKPYHPIMKHETVRKAMQSMLQTATGHVVGKETFEKFLRANPKLRHLTYEGSVKKFEVEKHFKAFAEHVAADPRFRFRKQAVDRLLYKGQATDISAKHFAENIADTELQASAKQGPSEEQQRATLRKKMRMQKYHRYQTIRERMDSEKYSTDKDSKTMTSISELQEPHSGKKGAKETKSSHKGTPPPPLTGGVPRTGKQRLSDADLDDFARPMRATQNEDSPSFSDDQPDTASKGSESTKISQNSGEPDDMEIG